MSSGSTPAPRAADFDPKESCQVGAGAGEVEAPAAPVAGASLPEMSGPEGGSAGGASPAPRHLRPGQSSTGSLFPVEGPGGAVPTSDSAGPHRCFRCEHFVVDEDADLCDWCLDTVAEELASRMIGTGW